MTESNCQKCFAKSSEKEIEIKDVLQIYDAKGKDNNNEII